MNKRWVLTMDIEERTINISHYIIEKSHREGCSKILWRFKIYCTYSPKYSCRLKWYFPMHR